MKSAMYVLLAVLSLSACTSGGGDYAGWALVVEPVAYGNFYSIPTTVGTPICEPNTDGRSSLILPIDGTPCDRLSDDTDIIKMYGVPYGPDRYDDTLDGFVAYWRSIDAEFGRSPPVWKTETTRHDRLLADELETIIVTDHFTDGRYRATAYALLSLNGPWGPGLSSEYTVTMGAEERDSARANALFMKVLRAVDLKSAK